MDDTTCDACGEQIAMELSKCPHCGRPSLFPNVTRVRLESQCDALKRRYAEARAAACAAGMKAQVDELESRARQSRACKALPIGDLVTLASSDTRVGATYYQQIAGHCRIPDSNKWDVLRRIADVAIHRSYGAEICFAALSTAGEWLSNYGEGAVFFKEKMIAHRATVFEENSAKWAREESGAFEVPPGKQALWEDRHMLVVAKLAEHSTGKEELCGPILRCGETSDGDSFLEVHIYGCFTFRSAELVVVKKGALPELKRADILERCGARGIAVQELT